MSGTRMQTVYFMRQVGTLGPVKIGCSSYVAERLEQLAVWSPVPLQVTASFPGGYHAERRLHWRFHEQSSHREWFHWSRELEDVIAAVNAGTFDVSALPLPPKGENPIRRAGWTDVSRQAQSLASRVRHTEAKHDLHLRPDLRPDRAVKAGDESLIAEAEAFIADPGKNGMTRAQWLAAMAVSA